MAGSDASRGIKVGRVFAARAATTEGNYFEKKLEMNTMAILV